MIDACTQMLRRGQNGTWITNAIRSAYIDLHRAGYAHAVEVRNARDELIGGIYGVAIGRMFFGESMFSREPDASQAAIAGLCQVLNKWGWPWLDGQVDSPHLRRLGGILVPRKRFLEELTVLCQADGGGSNWHKHFPCLHSADLT